MVASPGGEAHAASVIAKACSARRVMTTGLLIGANTASEDVHVGHCLNFGPGP